MKKHRNNRCSQHRRSWLKTTASLSTLIYGAMACPSYTWALDQKGTVLTHLSDDANLTLGLIADPQYADVNPNGSRYYRNSIQKLSEAVNVLNQNSIDLCVNLGDIIDREWSSFDAILRPLEQLNAPVAHTLGNHDFSVEDSKKINILDKLSLSRSYYSIQNKFFRFIILDTNEVSTYASAASSIQTRLGQIKLDALSQSKSIQAKTWNGALSDQQLTWLLQECQDAKSRSQRVILFAHHPIYPRDPHNSWSDSEILQILKQERVIAAWFNGHNHSGNFGDFEGVPCLTLKGMVETENTNSFAIVSLSPEGYSLKGFGREEDRSVTFRRV